MAAQHEDLLTRGGSAWAVRDTLERRPWELDDLRMLMNLPSEQAADQMLTLFGFAKNMGLDDGRARLDRLTTLLRTGESPPPIDP